MDSEEEGGEVDGRNSCGPLFQHYAPATLFTGEKVVLWELFEQYESEESH